MGFGADAAENRLLRRFLLVASLEYILIRHFLLSYSSERDK